MEFLWNLEFFAIIVQQKRWEMGRFLKEQPLIGKKEPTRDEDFGVNKDFVCRIKKITWESWG